MQGEYVNIWVKHDNPSKSVKCHALVCRVTLDQQMVSWKIQMNASLVHFPVVINKVPSSPCGKFCLHSGCKNLNHSNLSPPLLLCDQSAPPPSPNPTFLPRPYLPRGSCLTSEQQLLISLVYPSTSLCSNSKHSNSSRHSSSKWHTSSSSKPCRLATTNYCSCNRSQILCQLHVSTWPLAPIIVPLGFC